MKSKIVDGMINSFVMPFVSSNEPKVNSKKRGKN